MEFDGDKVILTKSEQWLLQEPVAVISAQEVTIGRITKTLEENAEFYEACQHPTEQMRTDHQNVFRIGRDMIEQIVDRRRKSK